MQVTALEMLIQCFSHVGHQESNTLFIANEKETIDSLIPLRIYGKVPAEYVELDTPPLFQGKGNDEFLYYIA